MKSIVPSKNVTGFASIDGQISPLKEKGEIAMVLLLSINIYLHLKALKDILVIVTYSRSKQLHDGLEELE